VPHEVFAALCTHVPPPHEVLQLAPQASLQQTPNAQEPLPHSFGELQTSPRARLTQVRLTESHFGVLPEHAVSVTQAPLLLQTCKVLPVHCLLPGTQLPPHIPVPATQANWQLVVLAIGQLPLASQVAALTCTRAAEQLAVRHWFAG
jgi:hypothetical protein